MGYKNEAEFIENGDQQWEYDESLGRWERRNSENEDRIDKNTSEKKDQKVKDQTGPSVKISTPKIENMTEQNELEYKIGAEYTEDWDLQWEYDKSLGQWIKRSHENVDKI